MDVGRDKLVLCFLCVFNGGFESCTEFIVNYLEVDHVVVVGKVACDGVVGSQSMLVNSVSIWGTLDYVALLVVGYCGVLVDALCLNGKSMGVVSVEQGELHFRYAELIGEGRAGGRASWCNACFLRRWFIGL